MFKRTWTWMAPLVAAAGTLTFVLASTPPGFGALADIVSGSPRGQAADAVAYALGAAASLGLITLIVMGLICAALELTLRRQPLNASSSGPDTLESPRHVHNHVD